MFHKKVNLTEVMANKDTTLKENIFMLVFKSLQLCKENFNQKIMENSSVVKNWAKHCPWLKKCTEILKVGKKKKKAERKSAPVRFGNG